MTVFDNGTLSANIRAMRARVDKTQSELANEIGVNIGTIVQYENGSMVPGSDKVCAIAEATGCTPNDLFGWCGEREAS